MNQIKDIAPDVNVPSLNELGNRPFAGGATLFKNMEEIWSPIRG
jgi:hypothetical protein